MCSFARYLPILTILQISYIHILYCHREICNFVGNLFYFVAILRLDLNFTYKSAIMPECGLTMYGVTKYQRVTVVTKVTIKNFDKIVLLMMTVD